INKLSPLDIPDNVTSNDWDDITDDYQINNVLDGSTSFDISHAGGEFENILADCYNEEVRQKDYCTRRDRTEIQTKAFEPQMKGMTDAYIKWVSVMGDTRLEESPRTSWEGIVEGSISLQVMDTY
ncbi:hypothetical protein C0991_001932, partial [Blastosporella zonata]